MFIIEDKGDAIAIMCASLLFLGTWPAVLTLLERRGRLPQHTYLDYSITNLFAAVFIALTFGQLGEAKHNMPNFFTQLSQDNWPSVLFAMAGGVVLSIGNLSTQYALAYVGLSLTEVISSSMVVVIGTTVNYFLDKRINRAGILFTGVACFLAAVILGSSVHASNALDNEQKLSGSTNNYKLGKTGGTETRKQVKGKDAPRDLEDGASADYATKAEAGTADYLIELEERRSIKVFGSSTYIGLGIVFFSGICFSLFSPAFNLATNDQWHTLKDGVPHLVVYTAFFYFSISCFIIGIGLNILFLYRPMAGVPKSSFKAYLNDWEGRQWALLAGFLCGFGNGFQFMGGQAAGYAAADAVQALPLVSTFWGILLFGEYRKSSKKTYTLLAFMLVMFIAAVATLMASSGHRSTK
ncbi:ureide permease 1 isoform X2 [Lolium perenne]|uniref:ureide permease 1 isoform X2 n=1 Tax=Lolium perenne TaxID=4522 RepID=UPI0021EB4358|nr:ureide permease 1-like isoform X2 [Lolium perenne]